MGFAQKGGRAIAVTMASAKKVRPQKILKIFLPECSCRTERAAVRSPVRVVDCQTEMLFVYRGIVYGELSAPIGGNVLRAGAGGLTKHHLSIPTKGYIKILKVISGRK